MDFNINNWLDEIIKQLKAKFADNLLFIGLQGSYNRGEATKDSDIDLIVILEKLDFEDLRLYKNIIENMHFKEKSCGFISGKKEIQNWSKHDLFQFYYDTKPLYGDLNEFMAPPKADDVKKSIKMSSENLYHSAVHSFLHSQNPKDILAELYKMTFFILQAKYFVETNTYIPTKKGLACRLEGRDKDILETCLNKQEIQNKDDKQIEDLYCKLIEWCRKNIVG